MRAIRVTVAVTVMASSLVLVTPVRAHNGEDVTPNKAGPIRRGETTMAEMREWFGEPSANEVVRVGCVRVNRVRWGQRLKVFTQRDDHRTADTIFVRKRVVSSSEHGDLTMHTAKGLKVGNRERRLRNLYPNAEPITHSGHTHYRLDTNREGEYVMAKVVDNRVVRLEVWPYEFC
jgi:hypothetical protein